jgi:hypothetical protein
MTGCTLALMRGVGEHSGTCTGCCTRRGGVLLSNSRALNSSDLRMAEGVGSA